MSDAVRLVRHTAIARAWHGRCYGRSDIGLSRAGTAAAQALVQRLVAWHPDRVVHSGLRRAARIAEPVARICNVPIVADERWRERDFGAWEGQRWSAIYRASGAAMDGMIDAPDSFCPGGGETTAQIAARARAALAALHPGRTLVIAHAGPIGALLGMRDNRPVGDWHAMVPQYGGIVDWTG